MSPRFQSLFSNIGALLILSAALFLLLHPESLPLVPGGSLENSSVNQPAGVATRDIASSTKVAETPAVTVQATSSNPKKPTNKAKEIRTIPAWFEDPKKSPNRTLKEFGIILASAIKVIPLCKRNTPITS